MKEGSILWWIHQITFISFSFVCIVVAIPFAFLLIIALWAWRMSEWYGVWVSAFRTKEDEE